MSDLTPIQRFAWDRSCHPCRDEAHNLCEGVVWIADDNDSRECACGCSANDSVVIRGDTSSRTNAVRVSATAKNQSGAHVSGLRVAGNDEGQA